MRKIITLSHKVYSSNDQYVRTDIWTSNEDNLDINHSLSDIHFIQDESGTDKLTFTVHADHPIYDKLYSSIAYCIAYEKKIYNNDGSVYSTTQLDFFPIIVDTDFINKKKSVTCASAMIAFDWTPAMLKEFDGSRKGINTFGANNKAYEILTTFGNEVSSWHTGGMDKTFTFNAPISPTADDNLTGAFKMGMDLYGNPYSELRNALFEKSGLRIRRLATLRRRFEIYECYSLNELQTEEEPVLITEEYAISSYNEVDDLTALYTHACGYVTPEQYSKQDGDETVGINKYKYRNHTVKVKTDAVIANYGARYMASSVDDEDFTADMKTLKSAVRATSNLTATIAINPAVLADKDVGLYTVLEVINEPAKIHKVLLITETDVCLDDATKSRYEVQDVTKERGIVDRVGHYDIDDYGTSVFG